MCCARLFAARSRMDGCWDRRSRFFIEMVFAVRDLMQDAYPELNETADRVSKAVQAEETRFAHTMEVGLEKAARRCSRASSEQTCRRRCIQALRHLRHAARLHAGCGARSGNRIRSGRFRSRDGRAEGARPGFVERRGEADCESRRISSCRNRNLKATARLGPTAAKCSRSFTTAKACANSRPAKRARSFSITRRSMPRPADRSAIADGSTPTITTRSSPT